MKAKLDRQRNRRNLQIEKLEDRAVMTTTFNLSTAGVLTLNGDNGANLLRITQSPTAITVQGASFGYKPGAVKGIVVNGNGGNDTIDLRTVHVPATINGGAGHDIIYGGWMGDVINGGDNDDRIWGGPGNDVLHGGTGDDRIFGNAGYDYIFGDAGTDFMDDCSRTAHEFYADQKDGSVDFIADMVAPAGKASADQVKQGTQNYTCHFLATLGSMAQAGVDFRNYIQYQGYNSDGVGVYNVKLYNGGQWVNRTVLFEGHTAATDAQSTVDYASWATIMSRAWNGYFGNHGGQPADAMRGLGRSPVVIQQYSNATFNSIGTALSRGYAVVTGTWNSVATSLLETTHAYQVVQTKVVNGVGYVQLRNPWGFDGTRSGDSAPRDGYLWVTWGTFAKNMSSVTIG